MKNYYLYLIRHGITEGNLDGKYIGQTDLALCPQGEKQIQQLVKAGVYPYVEKVYTSPLKRCVETAQIIYPDIQLSKVDEIAEMDFGQFEGRPRRSLRTFRNTPRGSREVRRHVLPMEKSSGISRCAA